MAEPETQFGYPVQTDEGGGRYIDVPPDQVADFRRNLAAQQSFLNYEQDARNSRYVDEERNRKREIENSPWSHFFGGMPKNMGQIITDTVLEPWTQPDKWEVRKARNEISTFGPELQKFELEGDYDGMTDYLRGVYNENPKLSAGTQKFLKSYVDVIGKRRGVKTLEGIFSPTKETVDIGNYQTAEEQVPPREETIERPVNPREAMARVLTNPDFHTLPQGTQTQVLNFIGKMKDADVELEKGWQKITDAKSGEIYRVNVKTGQIEQLKGPREAVEVSSEKGLTNEALLAWRARNGDPEALSALKAFREGETGKNPTAWSNAYAQALKEVQSGKTPASELDARAQAIHQASQPNTVNTLDEIDIALSDKSLSPEQREKLMTARASIIARREKEAADLTRARREEALDVDRSKTLIETNMSGRVVDTNGNAVSGDTKVGDILTRKDVLRFQTPAEAEGFRAARKAERQVSRVTELGNKVLRPGGQSWLGRHWQAGMNFADLMTSLDPEVREFAGAMANFTSELSVAINGARSSSDKDRAAIAALTERPYQTREDFLQRYKNAKASLDKALDSYFTQGGRPKAPPKGSTDVGSWLRDNGYPDTPGNRERMMKANPGRFKP